MLFLLGYCSCGSWWVWVELTYNKYQMANILQKARIAYRDIRFKVASIYRGEKYSAMEAAVAFNNQLKPKEKISLRYQNYPELNRYFMQFLNSAQTAGRVNGQNLAFLVGAESVGKSSYIESNLQKFKLAKQEVANRLKKQPLPQIHRYKTPEYLQNQTKQTIFDNQHHLLFNFNFKKHRALNFSMLLHQLQEEMISEMVRLNKKLDGGLLDAETVKEVVIAENAAEYVYVYLKDVLYCMLNDSDGLLLSQKGKRELEMVNGCINEGKVQALQFFMKNGHYKQVINVIAKDMNICETEAALRLFVSVAKRIQYEHRPASHLYSWYETGVESTNILFDMLNFLCGFGKFHKTRFDQYFFPQPGQQPLRSLQVQVKNGPRIDVGMFFLNMQELYIYDSPEFWQFIDHIIARASNSSGLRTHFPILLQFPNYSDFADLHNMGQFQFGSPVVIELPGYTLHQLLLSNANVAQLFTQKILTELFYCLGRNPNTWNKALAALSSGQAKMEEVIRMSAGYIKKAEIGLEARMNLVFTNAEILPQLADGSARYELIQHLRVIKKTGGLMQVDRPGHYIDFFTRPLWRMMMKENILYEHYYLPYIDVSELTNHSKLVHIQKQLIQGHWLRFLQWRWRNKGRYAIFTRQMRYRRIYEKQWNQMSEYRKARADPMLAETYYGANHNYIFHYSEKGIQMSYAS